jgi:hypothetical protein
MKETHIGSIIVDTGKIMLIDPKFIDSNFTNASTGYKGYVSDDVTHAAAQKAAVTGSIGFGSNALHEELKVHPWLNKAMCFNTGRDGLFDVYVKREGGTITEIRMTIKPAPKSGIKAAIENYNRIFSEVAQ